MGDIHSFARIDPTANVHDPHLSIFLQPEQIKVGAHSRIDGLVRLHGGEGLDIREHVHVASFCTINSGNGEVIMCNHSGCSNGVVIAGGGPDFAYKYICAADPPKHIHVTRKITVIGEHVFIGPNAVILPGASIGQCALVLAGAVVTKFVEPFAVVGGVPARVIGRRVAIGDGKLKIEWLPKLRDLAAQRDINLVRQHYGEQMPEALAVDLINFVTELG